MTGAYKCNIQTFESKDDKSAFIQAVVPEQSFQLEQVSNKKILIVHCSAMCIYPQPKLILM